MGVSLRTTTNSLTPLGTAWSGLLSGLVYCLVWSTVWSTVDQVVWSTVWSTVWSGLLSGLLQTKWSGDGVNGWLEEYYVYFVFVTLV